MRFTINLATRSCLDQRRINRYALIVIILLLGLTVWNVTRYSSTQGEISRLKADTAAIERKKTGSHELAIPEAELQLMKKRVLFYNDIIDRKSKNWLVLLGKLEQMTPASVAITSLIPGKGGDEWKIDGDAKDFRAIQHFYEILGATPGVTDVVLISHQNITYNVTDRGLLFSVSCKVVLK